jgi:capsular polysaccharide biosynthesis protein
MRLNFKKMVLIVLLAIVAAVFTAVVRYGTTWGATHTTLVITVAASSLLTLFGVASYQHITVNEQSNRNFTLRCKSRKILQQVIESLGQGSNPIQTENEYYKVLVYWPEGETDLRKKIRA